MNLKRFFLMIICSCLLTGTGTWAQSTTLTPEQKTKQTRFLQELVKFLNEENLSPNLEEKTIVFRSEGITHRIKADYEDNGNFLVNLSRSGYNIGNERLDCFRDVTDEVNKSITSVKLYLTEEGIVRLETGQYTRSAEDYKYAVIRYLRDLSAADKQFKELYDKCRIKIGKTVDGKESATTTNRKQSAYVPPEKTTVAVAQEKGDKPKPVDVVESKESATTVNRKQSAYVPPDKTMTAVVQEKGAMAVGGNLAVGMGDEIFGTGEEFTNFGIGAKFQYNVMTHLRLEGSFTYFFPKTWGGLAEVKLSMWDLSVNAHYLFPIAEKIKVYPLAGVGILGSKAIIAEGYIDTSTSTSEFGFNLGGGIDVKLSQAFIFNAEVKYKIGGTWKRFLISAGIAYRI